MKIIPELEQFAPQWYHYLSKKADLSTLKTAPNINLDMNKYTRCIVGECVGGAKNFYFDSRFPEFDQKLKNYSKLLNKYYHTMMVEQDSQSIKTFNNTIKDLLIYLRNK